MPSSHPTNRFILTTIEDELGKLKNMAERAFSQLSDDDFFWRLNADANSIFVIVKHLAGNMQSRFTDFLTTDGEKPTRHRDEEFVEALVPRQDILNLWKAGWQCVFDALKPLTDADLTRTVTIRSDPHSVFQAINRQTAHYAYHVGQIVLLAKHICIAVKGRAWNDLTVPRGQTEQLNRRMQERWGSRP